MSLENYAGLFLSMLVVALTPGPAVCAVISTAFSFGVKRSCYLNLGIILADYIFIGTAVAGLSTIATAAGEAFNLLRYFCAAYLVWMGFKMFRSSGGFITTPGQEKSMAATVFTGLMITLANPKAILFYAALLPVFVDLTSVGGAEVGVIMLTSSLTFGGVNLLYALMATKTKSTLETTINTATLNKTAGTLMMTTGAITGIKS